MRVVGTYRIGIELGIGDGSSCLIHQPMSLEIRHRGCSASHFEVWKVPKYQGGARCGEGAMWGKVDRLPLLVPRHCTAKSSTSAISNYRVRIIEIFVVNYALLFPEIVRPTQSLSGY